jgi:hypothetical protein
MLPRNIPDDLNIELLLSYFPEGSCKVAFSGLHKRNAYNDLMDLEHENGTLKLTVGRTSLYNVLPELMFHPIDRFDNLPAANEKELFEEECEAQEREIEYAYKFFAPIDLMLLRLRMSIRERLKEYVETDKIMIDILGDEISEAQRQNRFIQQTLPFLPFCKWIRGNRTHLTMMLRKVFMEEGLNISVKDKKHEFTDPCPRYDTQLGSDINGFYVDNTFYEQATTYDIHFWPESFCDADFLKVIEEIETFRLFIQDYFMGLEVVLKFNISYDTDPLCLSNESVYNFMNYNMNI